jgi:hypothetical protein
VGETAYPKALNVRRSRWFLRGLFFFFFFFLPEGQAQGMLMVGLDLLARIT